MSSAEILVDAFGRVRGVAQAAVEGAGPDILAARIDPDANSIAWLVWHLTRIQDDHLADAAGTEQVWHTGGWEKRFGLPFAPADTGYGHGTDDVASVRVDSPDLLTGYLDAVHEQTIGYVSRLRDEDLTRVVDTRWNPPVTLGVRLVSVISDNLQHAGQAAFVRGVLERRGSAV